MSTSPTGLFLAKLITVNAGGVERLISECFPRGLNVDVLILLPTFSIQNIFFLQKFSYLTLLFLLHKFGVSADFCTFTVYCNFVFEVEDFPLPRNSSTLRDKC